MKRNKERESSGRAGKLLDGMGIRWRMLFQLMILMAFIISLIWICQIAMLMSFFQNYRISQVRAAADTILRNIDHEDLDELADQISAENEVCVLMTDEEGNELLSIDHVRFCVLHHLNDRELRRLIDRIPDNGDEIVEQSSIAPFRNENYRAEDFEGSVPEGKSSTGRSMLYGKRVTFADGGTAYLMINAQITPTHTILSMLKRQFIYIVVLILLATAIIGTIMAENVSRPIIETNRAARSLGRGSYTRPVHSRGYREISELNDTLTQAAEELAKVESLQKELIANISHDLRTPLTMIQGYAETMRDIPDEMNPENMQIIIDETHRLSSLVNEVLEFSRLQTQKIEVAQSVFDLTDTVRAICQRVSAMTEKDGYRVICEAEGPCRVWGENARVEQVVYNLLGNALTYTGEDRTVILRQEDRGPRVRVSIQDSGKGIAPEELPYIWDRYYRTKESHRRAVIGSGLGLNICRTILENHHVPYGADSQEGAGTTFWFEMDKAEE